VAVKEIDERQLGEQVGRRRWWASSETGEVRQMRISPTKDTQRMEHGSLSISRSNDNVVVVIIVVVYRVGLSSSC
jgi:hypothetical protein